MILREVRYLNAKVCSVLRRITKVNSCVPAAHRERYAAEYRNKQVFTMRTVFRAETWRNFVERTKWKDEGMRREDQMQRSSLGRIDEMHFREMRIQGSVLRSTCTHVRDLKRLGQPQ